MPLSPEAADALAKLPLAALLILALALVLVGLARKWWVPGWLYERERDGRILAETQAERTASALEANNASMATLVKELAVMRREIKGLRDDVRALSAARDHA